MPTLEFFGGSCLPQIFCDFGLWVLVPWRYRPLWVRVRGQVSPGEFTERRGQRVPGTTVRCRSVRGLFWSVSFVSLLRTKQNWKEALSLDCNYQPWGLKGKGPRSECSRPAGHAAPTFIISPTKRDSGRP